MTHVHSNMQTHENHQINSAKMKKYLVTGGAGYIGSHVCIELLLSGCEIVVIDNLSRGSRVNLERVSEITGKRFNFFEVDIRDEHALERVFLSEKIIGVLHLAGLKSIGESRENPLLYFDNNFCGTVNLLKVMARHDVKTIVFSSSATVYGPAAISPIREDSQCEPNNPYGESKLAVEKLLFDISVTDPQWQVGILRYFNPIGAHESGLIGESLNSNSNNLIPSLLRVVARMSPVFHIYGGDYSTPDGTGVRDYIHVMDLAKGHLHAILAIKGMRSVNVWNLGTGKGHSVLEVVRTFEAVANIRLPSDIVSRRAGDVDECYADATKAETELGWRATYGLKEMCRDTWRWYQNYNNKSGRMSD